MPRFAANLSMLFTELPMLDRFAAAAAAGFRGVEILFPYDLRANELSRAAVARGLEMVLINAPPPNWTGGPRGFAADPTQEERFRRDFDRALRFAQVLRTRNIHIMAGQAAGTKAKAVFLRNLTWAAERAPKMGLTIEPLNPIDAPDYYLNDFDQAAEIIAKVGAPNLGLQFDSYHAQALTGDAMAVWRKHRALIRHIQIGAYPGRHEPIDGDFDFPAFFAELDTSGYEGWVSAEYKPSGATQAGLGWLP